MSRMNIYFSGLRDKIRILLAFIFPHLLMYGEKERVFLIRMLRSTLLSYKKSFTSRSPNFNFRQKCKLHIHLSKLKIHPLQVSFDNLQL